MRVFFTLAFYTILKVLWLAAPFILAIATVIFITSHGPMRPLFLIGIIFIFFLVIAIAIV